VTDTELELPQGWVECEISDIADVLGGKRLPKGHSLTKQKTSFPYIRVTNFQNNTVNPENLQFLDEKTHEKIKKYVISTNDLYISIAGSIGKVGVIPSNLNGANLTENAAKICNIEIEKKFLHYELNSPLCQHQISKLITSTNQGKLALFRIREIQIRIPSTYEQKRIVSKIEELFSKIESAKQSLEHTKLQLGQYRASLLKSAFEGKLTEQWRKENKINENYDNNPLGDLIIFSKNGFTGKPNELKKGTPRLGIETITQSNSIYIDEGMHKFIEIPKSKIETYRAKIGDLFVCRQNGNQNYVGKCAVFKEIISPMIFSDSLIQFRINTKLMSSTYLAFFLNSHLGRRQIEKFCSTTAGNFSINGINFKKTMIQYPSLLEQEQIVSIIEQGFSLIENTTQMVNSTLQQLQTIKMSVLKQAFEGKLVPQDPNDEPASVLLERIKVKQS